jgi:hypothetical protein
VIDRKNKPEDISMNAIDLIITVCAILSPTSCEERHLAFFRKFLVAAMHDERSALYRAMGRRAPEMDRREMALRISA